MTDRDKLPAITTTRHLVLPTEHSGSLVARGLEAIKNRGKHAPPISAEADDLEKIFADALGSYKRGDFAEAMNLYRHAAEQGHVGAHFNLGLMYDLGKGTDRSETEAIAWYRKAAELGEDCASFVLGGRYEGGRGVEKNMSEAATWYRKAAEQGYGSGALIHAARCETSCAAEQGDADAQFQLGEAYHQGDGVPQDDFQAAKWWLKAAEQGHGAAQYNLGCAYADGEGVAQSYVQAYAWFYLDWYFSSGLGTYLYNSSAYDQMVSTGEFLSPPQVVEAQKLAMEWAKKYMTSQEIAEAIAQAALEDDDAS